MKGVKTSPKNSDLERKKNTHTHSHTHTKPPPDKKSHGGPRYTTRIMTKKWPIIYFFPDDSISRLRRPVNSENIFAEKIKVYP